jgi:transcriptional regulator with XRE-family HTH domain
LRVAGPLDLSQAEVAEILGVSESSVSRMKEGAYVLGPKEFELAALLVRIYRSLDALMGGSARNVREWFHADNDHLQGVPAALARRIEGLTRVAQYLDFMRGAQ